MRKTCSDCKFYDAKSSKWGGCTRQQSDGAQLVVAKGSKSCGRFRYYKGGE